MATPTESKKPRGCSFLIEPVGTEAVFTPEQLTDDQKMFAASAQEFMEREVLPHVDALEKMDNALMRDLLRKAGEAGLLMAEVPEQYDGLDLDKVSIMLINEQTGRYGSFATAYGAHCTIGMLPLVFFGNDEQKRRLLPRLSTGEWLAAYALTEPSSGSDALGAKSTATLSEDGSEWILNGQKIWITNAGFADLFTVFAKVDGEHFTAFLVEAHRDGVSTGEEEKKMGLKGSSTRQLFLENVRIPKENLLGHIGKGHKIAFNILNLGRLKLGASSVGAGRTLFGTAVRYANERHQFKRPISSFGAIQKKIAELAVGIYAGEAMSFRVAGAMDAVLHDIDNTALDAPQKTMVGIEEFAVEASILKVFGSELIDVVADEALQIHGGYGYSAEYPVERVYRDIRVSRIYEGTNEINRMLIPGMILKRTMKGQLNLFGAVQTVQTVLDGPRPELPDPSAGPLAVEVALTALGKQAMLLIANEAIQKYMVNLKDQQQLLLSLADMIIDVYVMDSVVGRTLEMHKKGTAQRIHDIMTQISCVEAYKRILSVIEDLLPSLATGDKLTELRGKVDHLRVQTDVDAIAIKREIAAWFIEREKFVV